LIVRRDDGISRALGIEVVSADKIVFIDDDARPCDSYLSLASELLDEHPVIAGRVVEPPDAPFRDWEHPHYDHGDEPGTVDLLAGCNM
jgi:hypothetical protein